AVGRSGRAALRALAHDPQNLLRPFQAAGAHRGIPQWIMACLRLEPDFPIIHIADWMEGKHGISKDPILLPVLREHGLILVGFDRRTMAMHAGQLTLAGAGHPE